jgi:protein-tyrosine-phosphatase
MSSPFRVLFVCTANICRSPFLQLCARDRLGSPTLEFTSAGTHGVDGLPMSDEMAAEARVTWGLDTNGFRSRRLTAGILSRADLVLTAERRHRTFILDSFEAAADGVLTLGQAVGGDDIADPYRLGAEAQVAAARQMSAMLDVLPYALPRLLDPPARTSARRLTHG